MHGQKNKDYRLAQGGVTFHLLESGSIEKITNGHTQINLLKGNNLEGQASNLYLRLTSDEEVVFTPLIGVASPSHFTVVDNQAVYRGTFKSVDYKVILTVLEDKWFYDVNVTNTNNSTIQIDVFYGQDVAITGGISNEAYVCQYIDHRVFETPDGYVVASRQNQGKPHYLQQGSLTKTIGYSTDGFQFFGLDYRITNQPKALLNQSLENKNYQYEFAYTALQSEAVQLKESDEASFVFYGLFKDEIVEVATEARFMDEIKMDFATIAHPSTGEISEKVELAINFNQLLNSPSLTETTINQLYPEQRHQEYDENGELLAFFTKGHRHVVLKKKEQLVERQHGHIIINGNNHSLREDIISSTSYMFGVFNSHIVVGNTNFNQLTGDVRNPLNVMKASGQRIFVEYEGNYQLLGVPSVYELGVNHSKWMYQLADDQLIITSSVPVDSPQIRLDVTSKNNKQYRFIVLNQLVLGNENYQLYTDNQTISFKAKEDTMTHGKYPDLVYTMAIDKPFKLTDDRIFFVDNKNRHASFVVLEIDSTEAFSITTQGRLFGEKLPNATQSVDAMHKAYLSYFKDTLLQGFNVKLDNDQYGNEIDQYNDLSVWFTHNALVHYTSPHGLEQYSGAAWGTRDVCQGPAEYFLATTHFDVVRDIILNVYQHQFIQNGDWPQWFMFDRYHSIQARDSHGDIIVWPLHLLGQYLLKTNDFSILDEMVAYTTLDTMSYTDEKYRLFDHVNKQINTIQTNMIEGTHLSIYGGGDWNDSLQPANQALTESMVSGWTVALTYEAVSQFSKAIKDYNQDKSKQFEELAQAIKKDYEHYIIKDGVPAGFLVFEDDGTIKPILHPSDNETGLNYRLLPMQQGIIGELFTKEQADHYVDLMKEHLLHPDGIRLMNQTVEYKGGINTYFQRVETAANFGREIGLLYFHAHIRYTEAMAKLGRSEDAWQAATVINPINVTKAVPNALRRQSNTYFSSSDANFYNRYEAMKDFDKLRSGDVAVKGGWRIYSSGPGIYLNQLITNIFGIDNTAHSLRVDPVLPERFDGLSFTYRINHKPVTIQYHISSDSTGLKEIKINGKTLTGMRIDNPYRPGGLILTKETLDNVLTNESNTMDVYL